ncbi:MAG: hypothetical protein V8S82_01430 [Eubacteriales bacterium]|jgi:hypothetical protein
MLEKVGKILYNKGAAECFGSAERKTARRDRQMSKNPLKNISGEKIHRQYFNVLLFGMTFTIVMTIYGMAINEIIFSAENSQKPDFSSITSIIPEFLIGMLSVPAVLSVINRLCFGRVVCVLNDDGIHYKKGLIAWNDIVGIEYKFLLFGKHDPDAVPYYITELCFCYATVHTRSGSVDIFHAPFYMLGRVKKYRPEIDAKMSRANIRLIIKYVIAIMLVVALSDFLISKM